MARCVGTLPIGQVMIAKIRLHALRHMTQGRLLSEIVAKLGSPFLEFGQLGPQAPDLAVDARQLRPGLLLADVTVSCLPELLAGGLVAQRRALVMPFVVR